MGRKKPFIPKEWRVSQQPHVGLSCARMTTGVVPGSDGSDSRDESTRKTFLEKFTQGRNAQGRRRDSRSLAESLASPFPFNRGLSLAGTQVRCLAQDSSPASRGPWLCSLRPAGGRRWRLALGGEGAPGQGARASWDSMCVCPCLPWFLPALGQPPGLLPLPASSSSTRSSMCTAWRTWSSSSPWSTCRSQTLCSSKCPARPASTPPPIPMPPGCPDTRWERESREEQ